MAVAFLILALTMIPFAAHAEGAIIIIPDNYPTIQEGIDAAVSGDTVMVRDGVYLLTASIDFKGKTITVISENGADSCILDAQAATSVVYFHSGEGNDSVLSGFTIRNGKAQMGGGIRIEASSPTITDCIISANWAYKNSSSPASSYYAYGGGIYSSGSSPRILGCKISGNRVESLYTTFGSATWYALGGGIYLKGGAPEISDCVVDGNTAFSSTNAYGGGIYSDASSPSLVNTTIRGNSAMVSGKAQGGGIYFISGSPSLINCVISGNSAKEGGGIYFDASSDFSNLTNCTVARNTATIDGGGLYNANTSPKIINSILWEDSPQEVYNDATSDPTITYSDVYGGYTGTGNIDAAPAFVNMATQDFHLTAASACKNAGSNAAPYLPLQDKDGNARISGTSVDMGAYELSDTILYLRGGRFLVEVDWLTPTGSGGKGTPVVLTSDSGYFWFFENTNVELLVKMLDGQGVNGYYWFFYGAMTDVAYTITVTDTETSAVKTYYGIQHHQTSGNDIHAFE